jgi:hypothetical protein
MPPFPRTLKVTARGALVSRPALGKARLGDGAMVGGRRTSGSKSMLALARTSSDKHLPVVLLHVYP